MGYGACVDGECEYLCQDGAVACNGWCTFLDEDPDNCGACGNVCDQSTPYCDFGTCTGCPEGLTNCGGSCVDTDWDTGNCGACGQACDGSTPYCVEGACGGSACAPNTDFNWDSSNCGWCGNVCPPLFTCIYGVCEGY